MEQRTDQNPPPADDSKSGRTVNAVVNAMEILRELGRAGKPVGVHAIASQKGLAVSTVHRLLTSLVDQEFAVQVPETSEYTLGRGLLELLSDMVKQFDVRRSLRPVMERLNMSTKETVHLAVAVHSQIMDVDVIDSPQTVGVRADIGSLLPIHATSVGKIFLAYSLPFRTALLSGELPLPRLTPNTITEPKDLFAEIEKIARRGYSLNLGGRSEQTAGAAVPIFGLNGELVAALGVSGPISRYPTLEHLEHLAQEILQEVQTYSVPQIQYL
ncbi:MAG: IclR family transcriptional regulator [Acidimicrobiaceae bacterium]|nr:IclR family transcriptional regulator [Acidimicrobiaceae bacterium]